MLRRLNKIFLTSFLLIRVIHIVNAEVDEMFVGSFLLLCASGALAHVPDLQAGVSRGAQIRLTKSGLQYREFLFFL